MRKTKANNWKFNTEKLREIFWLWALSLLGVVLALPYQYSLNRSFINESTGQFGIFALFQIGLYAVFLLACVAPGRAFAEKVGLYSFSFLRVDRGRRRPNRAKRTAGISIITGLTIGVAIIAFEWFFFRSLALTIVIPIPVWQRFLASFYGGITEEIVVRFFLMSLIVWTLKKIWGVEQSPGWLMWTAVTLTAVVFFILHLPVTAQITTLSVLVVLRTFILNGLAGMVFGYLYWKKGLGSAMLAHFSMDVIIQVIYPWLV